MLRLSEKEYSELARQKPCIKPRRKAQKNVKAASVDIFPDDAWIPSSTPHAKALLYLSKNPEKFSGRAEHWEQCYVFEYVYQRYKEYGLMFAVPNSGRRGSVERGMMLSQGLKKGVPDIFLDRPKGGYHGLRIELKRTGGTPSDVRESQKEFIAEYNEEGYLAKVAYGFKECITIIEDYLALGAFNVDAYLARIAEKESHPQRE